MNNLWSPRLQQCYLRPCQQLQRRSWTLRVLIFMRGTCVGAEEALSKHRCQLSCFCQPRWLSMHEILVAWQVTVPKTPVWEKRLTYSCGYEMKWQLRWEEKCSEKWGQVISPQKLIGTTANFIHWHKIILPSHHEYTEDFLILFF